jgi:aerobic-type carbon monoxide dehydrogenase small subunit (CoxS/CutS family)
LTPFRRTDPARHTVEVTLEGRPLALDPGRSFLANLLTIEGAEPPGFLCAIGQCQRCLIEVDGEPVIACLAYPRGGEAVRRRPRNTV